MSYDLVYRKPEKGSYRVKSRRVGMPDAIKPGDLICFLMDGKFYDREVATVGQGFVRTAPLLGMRGEKLDKGFRIEWKEIQNASRRPPTAESYLSKVEPKTEEKKPEEKDVLDILD